MFVKRTPGTEPTVVLLVKVKTRLRLLSGKNVSGFIFSHISPSIYPATTLTSLREIKDRLMANLNGVVLLEIVFKKDGLFTYISNSRHIAKDI